ncbi:MAG: amidohydrolase [Thermoleophilia bacterium]|nr:amidohydrolase [Thermoleophilia bacterium]
MNDGVLRWWAPHALPVSAPAARDVLVTVESGRITGLEPRVSRERAAELGAELHDGCVIAPGFVNAHAHLEYAAYDALVDGLGFAEWIGDHIHRKRRLAPEQLRASAVLGAHQALHSGITCVGDASFSGDSAHAMHEVGLRGRVYLELFGGLDDAGAGESLEAALARLDGLPSSDLLEHGLSPHAPYSVGEALYRRVAASGLPWMTHLLESRDELAFVRGHGPLLASLERAGVPVPRWDDEAPVHALADILGPDVVAVHLTQAGPAELEVLAASGAAIAHCPRSNARLGCGRLDLAAVDRAGITVGLGTDSPASAGPIDPFAELRCALEVHRTAAQDPTWPSLAQLLESATLGAARALGYEELGSLDMGHHADLVAVHVGPCDDPLAAYVLGAGPSDVRAVLVAGRDAGVRDRTSLLAAREAAVDARTLLALPVRRQSPGARVNV